MATVIDGERHGFVFGLAGYSGAGKTSLAEKLIAVLVSRGHSVASIKHAHHEFDPDTPGKDSWRHRKAGAGQMLISSAKRRVKFTETPDGNEASLPELLHDLDPVDFVLVEGFKSVDFPKIEIWRQSLGDKTNQGYLHHTFPGIRVVASDSQLEDCSLPVIDLNNPEAIADLIERRLCL